MAVLSTFLESSLNFPFEDIKNTKNRVQSGKKTVLKFELSETQFEKTVRDKIACKTHLE